VVIFSAFVILFSPGIRHVGIASKLTVARGLDIDPGQSPSCQIMLMTSNIAEARDDRWEPIVADRIFCMLNGGRLNPLKA
jgi:hypothetical protein